MFPIIWPMMLTLEKKKHQAAPATLFKWKTRKQPNYIQDLLIPQIDTEGLSSQGK